MKIGDKVQFLSEKGGGFVAGFRGKDIVLVEDEDGFQIPTPISEVVIMSGAEEYKSAKTAGPKKAGAAEPDDTFNMSVKAKLNAMPADEDSEETEAVSGAGSNNPGLNVSVIQAPGVKCPRCWMHSLNAQPETGLCPRCAAVIAGK